MGITYIYLFLLTFTIQIKVSFTYLLPILFTKKLNSKNSNFAIHDKSTPSFRLKEEDIKNMAHRSELKM